MKKLALLLSVVFAAGLAVAGGEKAAGKTHEVQAEIVSADATAKTLTIKGEKENTTVPVDEKAVASLKTVKAGDKVTLVCRDDEKGEHKAVTAIKPAKAAAVAPVEKK